MPTEADGNDPVMRNVWARLTNAGVTGPIAEPILAAARELRATPARAYAHVDAAIMHVRGSR